MKKVIIFLLTFVVFSMLSISVSGSPTKQQHNVQIKKIKGELVVQKAENYTMSFKPRENVYLEPLGFGLMAIIGVFLFFINSSKKKNTNIILYCVSFTAVFLLISTAIKIDDPIFILLGGLTLILAYILTMVTINILRK